jgi:hypothetical protein
MRLSPTLIRDIAQLLPYCDLSELTSHDVALALPHLYLSYDEMSSGQVHLILRTLLPYLLRPDPIHAITPKEITDILSSMKHATWFTSLEYQLLAYLAQEMTCHALVPPLDAPFYTLTGLCFSLRGLENQYIDSPHIEPLLHAISTLLSQLLLHKSATGPLEINCLDIDLGAALYGLNRMSNTQGSSALPQVLSALIPFLKACPSTFTGRTLGSCLQGISAMACDDREVCQIIHLLSDRLEAHQEPLAPTTVSTIINSLKNKQLTSASVTRFTEILLRKLEEPHLPSSSATAAAFTPQQVLQMLIGVRGFDTSHPLAKRLHAHLIHWIQELQHHASSEMDAETFSQLLPLMGLTSSGSDAMRHWLKYLRSQIKVGINDGGSGDKAEESLLRSAPYLPDIGDLASSCTRFNSSQAVRCVEGLKGLKSEHPEVRRLIRDLTIIFFKSPDICLTEVELTKCYLNLRPMNKECQEVKNLFRVLHLKREAGQQQLWDESEEAQDTEEEVQDRRGGGGRYDEERSLRDVK